MVAIPKYKVLAFSSSSDVWRLYCSLFGFLQENLESQFKAYHNFLINDAEEEEENPIGFGIPTGTVCGSSSASSTPTIPFLHYHIRVLFPGYYTVPDLFVSLLESFQTF